MYVSQYCNVNLTLLLFILESIYKSRFKRKKVTVVITTTKVKVLSKSYHNTNQSE